jgi:hypothetical protein
MDYIGVKGVDGPDSTGVSNDIQATSLFHGDLFETPHPDVPQATRRLGILTRYCLLACRSGISGSLRKVMETKATDPMNEAGSALVGAQPQ